MLDGVDQARRLADALAAASEARAEFAAALPADLGLDDLADRAAGRPLAPLAPVDAGALAELRREVFRRRDDDSVEGAGAVAALRAAEQELAERRDRLDGAVLRYLAELDARALAASAAAGAGTEVLDDALDARGPRPITPFASAPAGSTAADDPEDRRDPDPDDDTARRRRGPLVVVIAVVVFAALMAGGVVAYGTWRESSPATTAPPSLAESGRPSPTATPEPTAPPTPTPTATPSCVSNESAAPGAENVGGYALQTPVDTGAGQYARGEATLSPAGVPIAYTVASNDLGDFVANRFCLDQSYLGMLNSVRRDGIVDLHPGDVLNLEAHSVLIVGTQRGHPKANPLAVRLPVQTQPYVEPAPTNWLPVQDSGRNEYATGEPVLRGGELVGYRIASEDQLGYIAERFGTTSSQLLELNCPRRGDPALYVGDILNLNPATVYSVGALNGVNVRRTDCTFSFPLPAQR